MTPPRIRRIARITLNVRDLRAVGDFYVDALGFTREFTEPTRVRLTLGGQEIELLEAANAVPYPTPRAFRDPEGHPLELSHAPESRWSRARGSGALCLGIDHTALATSDLEASRVFYLGLGFSEGPGSLNQGPEQARLDGLEGATVDIVTLFPPDAKPHVELLHYRSPPPAPARPIRHGDVAATCTTLEVFPGTPPNVAAPLPWRADPDGHLLQFTA